MTLALVLGDSHVCWLQHFVSLSGIRFGTGSSFIGTDCLFISDGFRGGHISSVHDENKIAGVKRCPVSLYRSVSHVVVCQIVCHQCVCLYSWEEGTQRLLDVNEFLKAVCNPEHLSFWSHRGFWQSQRNIFRGDGVHFNDLGNYKLWRSVKCCFCARKPGISLHRRRTNHQLIRRDGLLLLLPHVGTVTSPCQR